MTKHTQGEWKYGQYSDKTFFIKKVGDTIPITGKHMSKANARFIASAPDLLSACKTALSVQLSQGVYDLSEEANVNKLKLAINKAEGKENK